MTETGGPGTVLVAGASGLVGGAALARFAADGWETIGLSRRPPARPASGVRVIALDLLDPAACEAAAATLGRVTHLVYAAVNETPGDLVASWSDPRHAERNGRMFANLLDALIRHAPGLRHASLVHGTKAYAPHHPGHLAVPLRESMPRPDFDDFYFRQEDHLWARAAERGLGWTVLRAQIIVGGGFGGNLNGPLAICVYASLRKEAGLDLPIPGEGRNRGVIEMTDVDLLAKALAWAATAPGARDQVFNVTNGDAFVWGDLWPTIAEAIGLPAGAPAAFSFRAEIDRNRAIWAELVRRHDLPVPEDVRAYLGESAALADFALDSPRNVVTSGIKLRRAGFHEVVDSAESVVKWIARWRAEGLLPPR
jgi:nucleoside-diphosphate-sugar epimerase